MLFGNQEGVADVVAIFQRQDLVPSDRGVERHRVVNAIHDHREVQVPVANGDKPCPSYRQTGRLEEDTVDVVVGFHPALEVDAL